MNHQNLERLAPLSGVISVGLVVISALLINQWEYLPSAATLQEFYADNSVSVIAGGQVGLLAAVALIWFAGSLKRSLRTSDADDRLANLAFGGIVGAGVVATAGYSIVVAAGARGGAEGGIGQEAAAAMYDVYATLIGSGFGAALAVALLATGLAVLRRGGMAPWLAWSAIVLAVGSVTPAAFVFIGLDMLWIAIVSILLFRAGARVEAGQTSTSA